MSGRFGSARRILFVLETTILDLTTDTIHTAEQMKASLKAYIASASEKAGSDLQLGQQLGLTDGSRISLWKRGKGGRPNELTCARLAGFMDEDPLIVLRLAGHTELADLLSGHVGGESARKARVHLAAALTELDRAIRPVRNTKKRS